MLKAYIKDDFKNLLEYRKWVKETFSGISIQSNIELKEEFSKDTIEHHIEHDPDWFGPGTTFEELDKGITEFKSPELIQKVYDKIKDSISTSIANEVRARKLDYNATGLGVFIFDRAAMGLYRLKEYYSHKHQKAIDRTEVKPLRNGFVFAKDGSPVVERWEERSDGKPKIRTTNKKVFAWFPPENKMKKSVELFIGCGGFSDTTAEQFLYSGISAIIVAQLLEQAKIPTRINVAIGSSPDSVYNSVVYAALVPVKDYDERLDMNLLALLSSDPRFYRYEGLKGVLCLYDHFGALIPSAFGYGLAKNTLAKTIEQTGYSQGANLAPNRYYFGRTKSEQEAISDITKTIENLANKIND